MMQELLSEFRKSTTTLPWWLLGIGLAVVSVAATSLMVFSGISLDNSPLDLSRVEHVQAVYGTGVSMAYTVALILGVLLVTTEFQTGTIAQTLLATPKRGRVYGAKVLTGALSGVFFGALTLGGTVLVVTLMLGGAGFSGRLGEPDVLGAIAGSVTAVMLWTMIGIGVGALVQHQLVAVMVVIIWTQVVEPILRIVLSGPAVDYLPGTLTDTLAGGTVVSLAIGSGELGQGTALLVLFGGTAVVVLLGMLRFQRYELR